MIRFLIHKPIAVTMVYLALLILSILSITKLPVSMLPDIDIPEITIQISDENKDARQLEETALKPLRQRLQQISNLESLHSTASDKNATIQLRLAYGSNVDLAFIDVNEKVDQVVGNNPTLTRPKIIKASAGDIPVFYLNIYADDYNSDENFLKLSEFTDEVIRRRLEQLKDVAMADMSGLTSYQVVVLPNMPKLRSLGLTIKDLENAILGHNIEIGSISVNDGIYKYNLRFESILKSPEDIGEIWLNVNGRNVQIKDIAEVSIGAKKLSGLVTIDGNRGISIGVIKKSNAKIESLRNSLNKLIEDFQATYPELEFQIIRDQTRLLNYALDNLTSTLWIGAILAFAVLLIFLRTWQAPILIALAIPMALVISILFFFLAGLSINIISLSGLVLAVGLMIDNSIVVIDNISQKLDYGASIAKACIVGVNEMIRPLLSAVLTTCAVFIPLIYLSGIAGAILYDQAIAVSFGLISSFLVSITLIPVYFKIFHKSKKKNTHKIPTYIVLYEKSMVYFFRNPMIVIVGVILITIAGIIAFPSMKKERLPKMEQKEIFVKIDWNEHISIEENRKRTLALTKILKTYSKNTTSYIGIQDFVIQTSTPQTRTETKIYVAVESQSEIQKIIEKSQSFISNYKTAKLSFKLAESIIDVIFGQNIAPLTAEIGSYKKSQSLQIDRINKLLSAINHSNKFPNVQPLQKTNYLNLSVNHAMLLNHNIERQEVIDKLKIIFTQYQFTEINSNKINLPVLFGYNQKDLNDAIANAEVLNNSRERIPLSELVSIKEKEAFKSIHAGFSGEYYPIDFNINEKQVVNIKNDFTELINKSDQLSVNWTGSIIENKKLLNELIMVLLVSILLLFFILAAQFESLLLPLIVLIEIPIDIFGAILFLKLFRVSINVMSMIGIIIMIGITINDSILKIDTINRIIKNGSTKLFAVMRGGQIRLKPILMTSLTTILAMAPFLFMNGLGADLQKPLAITLIGGLFIGTIVSIYLIPILYYAILRNRKQK